MAQAYMYTENPTTGLDARGATLQFSEILWRRSRIEPGL